jgi:8-oxo-dGTP diphosphatase
VSDTVRAAGGVPYRERNGSVEVLLVHRPKYDDWTFPKGKNDPGESDEECVHREVEEETGLRVALERYLGESRYRDGKGRPKVARFWAVRPVAGEARPQFEVDDLEWLDPEEARARLSYDRDREILDAFLSG